MRINEDGGLVVEGQTESRVVAHFTVTEGGDENAERLLNLFEPPLPYRRLGWLAFASSRIEDFFKTSDGTEYRAKSPHYSNLAQQLIALHCTPNTTIFGTPRLGRRRFLQNRFRSVLEDMQADAEE